MIMKKKKTGCVADEKRNQQHAVVSDDYAD